MGWYYYAAAAAVKVASQVSQANGQAASFGAQKDLARQNSVIALEQGNAEEDIQRRHNKLDLGKQRAAAAESGFDSSSGSFLTLQGDSAGELEQDALTTRYNAMLRSIGYQNEARMAKASESGARTSGYLGAAGTIFSAAGGYGGGGGGGTYNYRGSELPGSLRGGGG